MTRFNILKYDILPKTFCGMCQEMKPLVQRRRMNTQYADNESNYVECCLECFRDIEEGWAEQWRDYWAGRL